MSELKFKILNKNATVPAYATEGSAGLDLASAEDFTIMPGEIHLTDTSIFSICIRGNSFL